MSVTRFVTLFSMFLTTLIVVGRLGAAQVWDNSASTWEWNTALNWSGDVVPTSSSGNDAVFDGTSPSGTPVTVTGATPLTRHLSFGTAGGGLAPVASYTFNAGASGVLNFRAATSTTLQNSSSTVTTQTFNVPVSAVSTLLVVPMGGGFVFNGSLNVGTNLNFVDGDLDNVSGTDVGSSIHPVMINGGLTGGAVNIDTSNVVTIGVAGATYTGATNVNKGTYLMNGTHTGGAAYAVAIGATLGGTGSIAADAVINGTLAPGAGIESLGITGNVDLNGMLAIEFNSSDDSIDLLNVTGALDLTGGGISFVDLGSFSLDQPAYVFATYGSLIGDPAVESGVPAGYKVEYHYDNGVNTNNIALVPVPEPNAIGLVLLGLLGLTGLRAGKLS